MTFVQVRLVANINGNEAAGREILMQLGEHLLVGYGKVDLVFSRMKEICHQTHPFQ